MGSELKYTTLGELCDPERGITYGIVKVGDFVPGGVPVVRGGDIRNGRIVFDNEKRVTEEVSQQFQRTILRGGEILINLIAEPGHTAIVPAELRGANVSRDVAVIPLNDSVNHRYVDYCLKSPTAISWLTSRLQGSVTQKINLGILRELPIPVPPSDKQRAIADILGSLDDKIELNRRRSETLEATAKLLFKSWFVDFNSIGTQDAGVDLSGRLDAPNERRGDRIRWPLPVTARMRSADCIEQYPVSGGQSGRHWLSLISSQFDPLADIGLDQHLKAGGGSFLTRYTVSKCYAGYLDIE